MIGVRLPDNSSPRNPGEYTWMSYRSWVHKPSFFVGEGEWHLMDPTGGVGAIGRVTHEKPAAHSVTIHEDGAITCSPSLVMPSGWHGWLEHGVWRSV